MTNEEKTEAFKKLFAMMPEPTTKRVEAPKELLSRIDAIKNEGKPESEWTTTTAFAVTVPIDVDVTEEFFLETIESLKDAKRTGPPESDALKKISSVD